MNIENMISGFVSVPILKLYFPMRVCLFHMNQIHAHIDIIQSQVVQGLI